MPKRTRSHELETESETAFQAALPSRWVYRRKDKDYGIDGEVEIFDAAGKATGNIFLVQLKATDNRDLQKALRLRLRIETGRYYASLELPLLVVRYHAPTDTLYVRWFHSLDVYYGKRTAKGVTFNFDEENKWTTSTPAALEQAAAAYRNTGRPTPKLPIEISVQITEPVLHGMSRIELATRLAAAARPLERTVRLEFPGTVSADAPDRILMTPDRMAVFIGHRPAMTIHTPKGVAEDTARASLPSDVLMAVGLAFDWIGHSTIGAEIVAAIHADSRLTRYMPTAEAIARCLKRARRAADSLQIARSLMLGEHDRDVGFAYVLPVFFQLLLEPAQRRQVIDGLTELADELAHRGDRSQAAALHYSCGNALRAASDYRRALRQYHTARRLNPAYVERAYYERELAGVLFLLNRFRLAAEHYSRALTLQADRDTQLVYADALMFSGRYREALQQFTSALGDSPALEDAEWILKEHALNRMLTSGVPDVQNRQRVVWGTEPFDPRTLTDDEIVRECELALAQDALSSLAWFNLGGVCYRRRDLTAARDCFLMAALTNPGDIEGWNNAAACAMSVGDEQTATLILVTANELNREDFVLKMLERLPPQSREPFADLTAALGETLAKSRKAPPIIRVHKPDGTWAEVRVDTDKGQAD